MKTEITPPRISVHPFSKAKFSSTATYVQEIQKKSEHSKSIIKKKIILANRNPENLLLQKEDVKLIEKKEKR